MPALLARARLCRPWRRQQPAGRVFGPQGDTRWNQERLRRELPGFVHHELDIRDRAGVLAKVAELKPDAIVHTAAQPSHDRAAAIPFDDFDTNAVGTLNLLEAARRACPETPAGNVAVEVPPLGFAWIEPGSASSPAEAAPNGAVGRENFITTRIR